MTTYVSARNAIVGVLHPAFTAAYPTIPIYYENAQEIDMDAAPDVIVIVSVDFTDNLRLDIDPAPHTEVFGEVSLRIYTRVGRGVSDHLTLFGYLSGLLSHQVISGVTMGTAFPDRKETAAGWLMTDLVVPFSFFA